VKFLYVTNIDGAPLAKEGKARPVRSGSMGRLISSLSPVREWDGNYSRPVFFRFDFFPVRLFQRTSLRLLRSQWHSGEYLDPEARERPSMSKSV
jgi:hypothetical protein